MFFLYIVGNTSSENKDGIIIPAQENQLSHDDEHKVTLQLRLLLLSQSTVYIPCVDERTQWSE